MSEPVEADSPPKKFKVHFHFHGEASFGLINVDESEVEWMVAECLKHNHRFKVDLRDDAGFRVVNTAHLSYFKSDLQKTQPFPYV